MKGRIFFSSLVAWTCLSATPAGATTVATIGGCYDCYVYDTPTLIINNTTGGTMTNAQLLLTGYQGANNGQTLTVNLGTLATGTTQLNWGSLPGVSGSTTPNNLAAYDYDDEFIGTSSIINSPTCGGGCVPAGSPVYYAQVGNFSVTFTAVISGGLYNGQSVYSVFSPTTNATGSFVGWEGLDPSGYSEQPGYDVHTGIVTGHLADINLGLPPILGVPEPATWAMMLVGFGGIGFAVRRRRDRPLTSAT